MFLDIIFIMILVFVIQYFVMSWLTTNSSSNITTSLNKIYLGTIYGLMTGFVYVLLMDFKQGFLTNCSYYMGLGIGIGVLMYAYKNQLGITNNDWANSMIELQSNGIMLSKKMSEQIPTSVDSNQFKSVEFAKYIVEIQQEQINFLKNQIISNSAV